MAINTIHGSRAFKLLLINREASMPLPFDILMVLL